MLKIESNLKINGRHWGLAFTDGIAHTANVALAAKLLLKGYVVTDEQPEAEPLKSITAGTTPAIIPQPEAVMETETEPNNTAPKEMAKTDKLKTTKPRKRAVKADAADESGV